MDGSESHKPVLWGVVFGGLQAASPLGFWWLDPATVHAVADPHRGGLHRLRGGGRPAGRPGCRERRRGGLCVLAAIGVTGPAWLLVLGFTGHGLKDVWQERRHNVANTRW